MTDEGFVAQLLGSALLGIGVGLAVPGWNWTWVGAMFAAVGVSLLFGALRVTILEAKK